MSLPTASKLELADRCAASWVLPQTPEAFQAGDDGNALHAFAQAVAAGADVEAARAALPLGLGERADDVAAVLPSWLGAAATEAAYAWDYSTDEGRFLGTHLGFKYNQRPNEYAGAADWADGSGRILDLKTGRIAPPPAARNLQLHALALAMARANHLDRVEVTLLHVPPYGRPQVDTHMLDYVELEAVAARLSALAQRLGYARDDVRRGKTPRIVVGEHCRHCKALESCPRTLALMRATGAELEVEESKNIAMARDGDVLALRDFAQRLLQVGHRARGVAESIARQRAAEGRPVLTPEGREWREVVTTRRVLDGSTTYRVLAERYGGEVALRAVRLEATQTSVKAALQDGVEAARRAWKESPKETRGPQPTAKQALADVVRAVEAQGGLRLEPRTEWSEVDPTQPALSAGEESET